MASSPQPSLGNCPVAQWGPFRSLGFRLLFCYFSIYLVLCWLIETLDLESAFGLVHGAKYLVAAYSNSWALLVTWTGKQILQLPGPLGYRSGGNSDGIFSYVQLLCFAVLAVVAALVWTALNRKRRDYRRQYALLRVCLRYALAFSMLSYGTAKMVDVQFHLHQSGLVTNFGDFPPFEVLSYFMGYSRPYTFFAGAAEVLAGVLLLFRRTATLGALVAFGVLSNVVMLNFCYDWPEKLNSSHLLAMSAIIIAPDIGRLASVFVLNMVAIPASLGDTDRKRWKAAAKTFVIAYMLATVSIGVAGIYRVVAARPPLYGIYQVDEFTRNGEPVPPLITDPIRWRAMVVESAGWVLLKHMDDTWTNLGAEYDAARNELSLSAGDGAKKDVLSCSLPDNDHLILRGSFRNDSISVRLTRVNEERLKLLSQRFRWINGSP
jgi:uncharacterized membrane protein YphA (DoxX/SURF4 family)